MKLICIPLERYNNMKQRLKEDDSSLKVDNDLKKDVAATMKAQETQELISRKQEYKETHEEIPKNLDKKLPQTAVTLLPPPDKRKKSTKTIKEKPPKPKKTVAKKTKTLKTQPILPKYITYAYNHPPKTFQNWKFIED